VAEALAGMCFDVRVIQKSNAVQVQASDPRLRRLK
jgi:hypothetical protein